MTMPPILGSVKCPGDIHLGIIDCKSWRIRTNEPVCSLGLDLSKCSECPSRTSRDGNITDPPLFIIEGRPDSNSSAPSVEPSKPRMRGLGDVIAAATKAVGIAPCGGCKKRQDALNAAIPFTAQDKPSDPV